MAGASSWCDSLRLVLLGKTGAGKSSLGNTILGRDLFGVGRGMSSETRLCNWKDGMVGGTLVEVTDTPGLCDTHLSEEEIFPEVGKSVACAAPGPHVLIIVLRADRRFTAEEFQAYLAIKQIFGPGIQSRMIVVFNGLDGLGDDPGEQKECLDDQVRAMGGDLHTLLGEADYRYIGMNNKASRGEKARQAQELLGLIRRLVREGGGPEQYFTSPLVNQINGFKQAWVHHYITKNRCTPQQAEKFFKENIQHERGLLQTMGNAVASFARSAGTVIKNVCVVM